MKNSRMSSNLGSNFFTECHAKGEPNSKENNSGKRLRKTIAENETRKSGIDINKQATTIIYYKGAELFLTLF